MQPGGAAWSSSAAWPGSLDYAPGEKQAAHWEVRASCLLDRHSTTGATPTALCPDLYYLFPFTNFGFDFLFF
jgi:hypothetical protein